MYIKRIWEAQSVEIGAKRCGKTNVWCITVESIKIFRPVTYELSSGQVWSIVSLAGDTLRRINNYAILCDKRRKKKKNKLSRLIKFSRFMKPLSRSPRRLDRHFHNRSIEKRKEKEKRKKSIDKSCSDVNLSFLASVFSKETKRELNSFRASGE